MASFKENDNNNKRVNKMSFEFHNPTRLIFGAGVLEQLGVVAANTAKRP